MTALDEKGLTVTKKCLVDPVQQQIFDENEVENFISPGIPKEEDITE